MKLEAQWPVTLFAVLGLGGPDALNMIFSNLDPILDALVRLGQFGVAVFTCIYIYRKGLTLKPRKRKAKKI